MIGTCCRLEGCAAPCRQLHSMNKRGKGEGAFTDHRSPIEGGGGAQLEAFFWGEDCCTSVVNHPGDFLFLSSSFFPPSHLLSMHYLIEEGLCCTLILLVDTVK